MLRHSGGYIIVSNCAPAFTCMPVPPLMLYCLLNFWYSSFTKWARCSFQLIERCLYIHFWKHALDPKYAWNQILHTRFAAATTILLNLDYIAWVNTPNINQVIMGCMSKQSTVNVEPFSSSVRSLGKYTQGVNGDVRIDPMRVAYSQSLIWSCRLLMVAMAW